MFEERRVWDILWFQRQFQPRSARNRWVKNHRERDLRPGCGYECSGMDEYECTGTWIVFFQICNHMLTFQLSSRSEIYKIFASLYRSKLKNYCVTRILDSRWSLLGWLTNFQLVSPNVTNWPNWPNLIFAIDQWFSQLVSKKRSGRFREILRDSGVLRGAIF